MSSTNTAKGSDHEKFTLKLAGVMNALDAIITESFKPDWSDDVCNILTNRITRMRCHQLKACQKDFSPSCCYCGANIELAAAKAKEEAKKKTEEWDKLESPCPSSTFRSSMDKNPWREESTLPARKFVPKSVPEGGARVEKSPTVVSEKEIEKEKIGKRNDTRRRRRILVEEIRRIDFDLRNERPEDEEEEEEEDPVPYPVYRESGRGSRRPRGGYRGRAFFRRYSSRSPPRRYSSRSPSRRGDDERESHRSSSKFNGSSRDDHPRSKSRSGENIYSKRYNEEEKSPVERKSRHHRSSHRRKNSGSSSSLSSPTHSRNVSSNSDKSLKKKSYDKESNSRKKEEEDSPSNNGARVEEKSDSDDDDEEEEEVRPLRKFKTTPHRPGSAKYIAAVQSKPQQDVITIPD